MLIVKKYVVGKLLTNCYIVTETSNDTSVIIDPGGMCPELEKDIKNFDIKMILLTHGHFDHIFSSNYVRKVTGAKIVVFYEDKDFLFYNNLNLSTFFKETCIEAFKADICLKNEDIILVSNFSIKVLHTPGHTRGSVCYLIGEHMFSGDTLFKGSTGRTDFFTGSKSDMKESLKKLYNLNANYIVYPGHGDVTSLNKEKLKNNYGENACENIK